MNQNTQYKSNKNTRHWACLAFRARIYRRHRGLDPMLVEGLLPQDAVTVSGKGRHESRKNAALSRKLAALIFAHVAKNL